jgi:hypothetical protein
MTRDGQTWMIAIGENDRTLTFTVIGESNEPGFVRALLLLDTWIGAHHFESGCILKVEDGAWEKARGTHQRIA